MDSSTQRSRAATPSARRAAELSLDQMKAVRSLAVRWLKKRPAAAVPLGTLELLLGKVFKAVMAVDPQRLTDDPTFTADGYVKLLTACARLAEALVKVELARARIQEQAANDRPRARDLNVIPAAVLADVEKGLRLL